MEFKANFPITFGDSDCLFFFSLFQFFDNELASIRKKRFGLRLINACVEWKSFGKKTVKVFFEYTTYTKADTHTVITFQY